MVSLEEDPCDNTESVSENFQWPATRGPSLDDEQEAAKFVCEMNAALQHTLTHFPVSMESPAPEVTQVAPVLKAPPRWASIEDEEDLPEFMQMMGKVEEEAVTAEACQWPATRGPSLDEFAESRGIMQFAGGPMILNLESLAAAQTKGNEVPVMPMQMVNEFLTAKTSFMPVPSDASTTVSADEELSMVKDAWLVKSSFMPVSSDASTTVSTDEDHSLTTPPSGLSDDEGEKDTSATLKISLTDTLGLWSVGSAAHETGTCKPCAFLWKDPKQPGCQNGRECVFCHLCPPGEVKIRKKQKMFMRKLAKNLQCMDPTMDQYAMGFEPNFNSQYQNEYAAGYGMW